MLFRCTREGPRSSCEHVALFKERDAMERPLSRITLRLTPRSPACGPINRQAIQRPLPERYARVPPVHFFVPRPVHLG